MMLCRIESFERYLKQLRSEARELERCLMNSAWE